MFCLSEDRNYAVCCFKIYAFKAGSYSRYLKQLYISYIFRSYIEDFDGNTLVCLSLEKKIEGTFLAISYNMQAALKLSMTSLTCLFFFFNFESVSFKKYVRIVFFKATPSEGLHTHGSVRHSSVPVWRWEGLEGSPCDGQEPGNWKGCFQPKMFSCKGKRFSSLLEINHILKTGTASRMELMFSGEGCWVCRILSC